MTTHPHFLFVYGTLKPGHGNNPLIERFDGKDIGVARTIDKFVLNGGFPYVWKLRRGLTGFAPYLGHVIGHLYKVSDAGLEACDRLEGHPRHYCRTPITVSYGPAAQAKRATAGIYLMQGDPIAAGLQTPLDELLEWGRAEPKAARNFQRKR